MKKLEKSIECWALCQVASCPNGRFSGAMVVIHIIAVCTRHEDFSRCVRGILREIVKIKFS